MSCREYTRTLLNSRFYENNNSDESESDLRNEAYVLEESGILLAVFSKFVPSQI